MWSFTGMRVRDPVPCISLVLAGYWDQAGVPESHIMTIIIITHRDFSLITSVAAMLEGSRTPTNLIKLPWDASGTISFEPNG